MHLIFTSIFTYISICEIMSMSLEQAFTFKNVYQEKIYNDKISIIEK